MSLNDEIIVLALYSIVIFQIIVHNNGIIKRAKNMHKNRLIKTISNENRFIEIFTYSSITSIAISYFYLSINIYIIFIIETFILVFSFSSLKKNLQKELNTRS